jgi:mannose-6-phosphate isomerase-like protein (cupin superfamily)
MEAIEHISHGGRTLVYIIRAALHPAQTQFVTSPEMNQQVGFVVYPCGGQIARHFHKPLERRIVGTAEVLVVRQGRCEIEIFSEQREWLATRQVARGDVIVILAGGHGFRMLEDTVLLEIKQGPYTGMDEKERF